MSTTEPEVSLQQLGHELGPGAQFGRYRIVRLIGAGAMGTVYEATHVDLKKQVAFKALNPAVALDDEARKRFLHEGEVASKIRHPNVVEVFDVGIEHNVPYLVMEFLEGEALSDLLAREAPLPPEQLASIMLPVLAAVATAHEEGVLHRDLKPDNIFLARSRHDQITPKLLDFGISKLTDAQEAKNLTGGGTLLGTPMYMSPEAATRARNIDQRSDQYSLGVILYEASTGNDPFDGETLYTLFQAIVAGRFAPPRTYQPELPQAFEALICRAMATEPEFRFPSVAALGRALLPFAPPRDCVIWGPAFEPKRVAGSPLTPSEFPSANMELQSLKSSFLDSDLWTVKKDASLSEPDDAGVFRKPASLITLDEDDPSFAPPAMPHANGDATSHAKSTPGLFAWDATERAERQPFGADAVNERRRGSRPSHDRASLSTLDDAVVERVVESRGRVPWALGGALLVLVGIGVGFMLSRAQKTETASAFARDTAARPIERKSFRMTVAATPPHAELLLDGVSLGLGRVDKELPLDGNERVLTVRAEGFETQEIRFREGPPPGLVSLAEVMPQGLSPEAAPSVATDDTTDTATTAADATVFAAAKAQATTPRPAADARRGLGRAKKNRVESASPAYAPPAAPTAAPVPTPRAAATANDAPILD